MEYLISKSKGYQGSVQSTITHKPYVDYSNGLTLNQYNKANNMDCIALTWDELEPLIQNFNDNLITKWEEIEESNFFEMFECLPPLRFTKIENGFLFFISEGTTGNLHQCYIKHNNKYYSALKRVTDSTNKLLKDFNNEV